MLKISLIVIALLSLINIAKCVKLCSGEGFRLDHNNTELVLTQLEEYFSNCEYIYNNLEISFQNLTRIAEFTGIFSGIKEIFGFMLLENIEGNNLNFDSLIIIRGTNLITINGSNYTLVIRNTNITSLLLPNLREISQNGVIVSNNNSIDNVACNLRGVNWTDIVDSSKSSIILDESCPVQSCANCNSSNARIGCWNSTICQIFDDQDCDPFCAVGCTGPEKGDCLSCTQCFNNITGECSSAQTCTNMEQFFIGGIVPTFALEKCAPPLTINFKICNLNCVSLCLDYSTSDNIIQNITCLSIAAADAAAEQCGIQRCNPYSTDSLEVLPPLSLPLLPEFTGCGNELSISNIILTSESYLPINPITPVQLENFTNIETINGYLMITGYPSYYGQEFNFLSKLKKISGERLYQDTYALYIANNSFQSIDLRALENVSNGEVYIEMNTELCWIPSSDRFAEITTSGNFQVQTMNRIGCVCDSRCKANLGCWGPTNYQCVECQTVTINGGCFSDCDTITNHYHDPNSPVCVACDPECNGCTGSGSGNCTECRNFIYNGNCVSGCSIREMYVFGNECISCSDNCTKIDNNTTCAGIKSVLGLEHNGCRECKSYFAESANQAGIEYRCVSDCGSGYFENSSGFRGKECAPCNELCTKCNGREVGDCDIDKCTELYSGENDSCITSNSCDLSLNFIATILGRETCTKCHELCLGCDGTSINNCISCKSNLTNNRQCVENCLQGQLANRELGECENCDFLCGSCELSIKNCTTCSIARLYDSNGINFMCLASCPSGMYRNSQTKNCIACHQYCLDSCSGPSNSDCLNCSFAMFNGACHSKCPNGTVLNTVTKQCLGENVFEQIPIAAIIGLSIGGLVLVCIIVAAVFGVAAGVLKARKMKRKQREKFLIEEGIPLTMKPRGTIAKTLDGLPEQKKLGMNWQEIEELTPEKCEINNVSDCEIVKQIGSGFYGSVHEGYMKIHGDEKIPVAIKMFYSDCINKKSIVEMINDLAYIEHDGLIRIMGYHVQKRIIFYQLVVGPTLKDYVCDLQGYVTEEIIFSLLVQIINTMVYLEENNIIHGSLCARNVILYNYNQIKLSDYQLHRFCRLDEAKAKHLPIPLRWMSPEYIKTGEPTHKSDIWAFGVLFWEVLSFGLLPYHTVADEEIEKSIAQGKRLQQPLICSVDLYGLLIQCFLYEAASRPTFKKIGKEVEAMARYPTKYINIKEETLNLYTKTNSGNKVKSIPVRLSILDIQDSVHREPEEAKLGEYVDEEVVVKNIIENEKSLRRENNIKIDKQMDSEYAEIDKQMDSEYAEIDKQLDSEYTEIDKQMDSEYAEIDKQLDSEYAEIDKQLDSEYAEIDKQMDSEYTEIDNQILANVTIYENEEIPRASSYLKPGDIKNSKENPLIYENEEIPRAASYLKPGDIKNSKENPLIYENEEIPRTASYLKPGDIKTNKENPLIYENEEIPRAASYLKPGIFEDKVNSKESTYNNIQ